MSYGDTLKFYADRNPDPAKRTGLTVQYTLTRKNDRPTISLEIAPIPGQQQPPDWSQKIVIQLSKTEFIGFACVLLGHRKEAKAKFHGDNNNKGFILYNNGSSGVALSITEKGVSYQHMISHDQRIELTAFVMRRMAESWSMTVTDSIALLNAMSRVEHD